MRPNNVNVEGMMAFLEQAKQDPGVLKKQKRVEGTWSLTEGRRHFSATLDYPAGQRTLEADLASFMGGSGIAPDPIQYCLCGLAACFPGTFVALAAADGVALRSLKVIAENNVDLTGPMGLGDKRVVERVSLKVVLESDADDARLRHLEQLAREGCPGVFCLTQPIPLETSVEKLSP
jgi:uncharacterized OsmC-like protein